MPAAIHPVKVKGKAGASTYLSVRDAAGLVALVQFGTITGRDPQSLGFNEIAAHDLGISGRDAFTLQRVAAGTLGFAVMPAPIPEPATVLLLLAGLGMLGFVARRRAA